MYPGLDVFFSSDDRAIMARPITGRNMKEDAKQIVEKAEIDALLPGIDIVQ
jgi:hypothetical protein